MDAEEVKYMKTKTLAAIFIISGILWIQFLAAAEDYSEWKEVARLSVTAVVAPYTSVKLSVNEIAFDIKGEPGDYDANQGVSITVGSNQSKWSVHAKANELIPESDKASPLPSSRLAFSINDENDFKDLGESRLLIEGEAARPPTAFTLNFRLTTAWEDLPGTYRGDIIFSFLSSP